MTKRKPDIRSLFIYGTGRLGEANDWIYEASDGTYYEATALGVLTSHAPTSLYPIAGFVPPPGFSHFEPHMKVVGEIVDIDFTHPRAIEFCQMELGSGYEAMKISCMLTDLEDTPCEAWVFHYPNWTKFTRNALKSGDWMDHPSSWGYQLKHAPASTRQVMRVG